MAEPKRITPEEVNQKLKTGKVLLVCAYEDEAKFRKVKLQGAISLIEFKAKLPSLAKDQEVVFYCAWPKEASAAGQAVLYFEKGYKNSKCLEGGVEAWKKAGYAMINPE